MLAPLNKIGQFESDKAAARERPSRRELYIAVAKTIAVLSVPALGVWAWMATR
jgi:hypothetical protein